MHNHHRVGSWHARARTWVREPFVVVIDDSEVAREEQAGVQLAVVDGLQAKAQQRGVSGGEAGGEEPPSQSQVRGPNAIPTSHTLAGPPHAVASSSAAPSRVLAKAKRTLPLQPRPVELSNSGTTPVNWSGAQRFSVLM